MHRYIGKRSEIVGGTLRELWLNFIGVDRSVLPY